MKMVAIALWILLLISCDNQSGTSKTTDSISVNTTESNRADGGPNNGLGDTNKHKQMNDTITHDTLNKK
ncbi:MAG TPA: hypothetical protein VGQ53_19830 [Chitinophagaceae bacterium]|jgi:hypothetical protein|nr:hypothetical protein [Chitinophagaceae bacterium]